MATCKTLGAVDNFTECVAWADITTVRESLTDATVTTGKTRGKVVRGIISSRAWRTFFCTTKRCTYASHFNISDENFVCSTRLILFINPKESVLTRCKRNAFTDGTVAVWTHVKSSWASTVPKREVTRSIAFKSEFEAHCSRLL